MLVAAQNLPGGTENQRRAKEEAKEDAEKAKAEAKREEKEAKREEKEAKKEAEEKAERDLPKLHVLEGTLCGIGVANGSEPRPTLSSLLHHLAPMYEARMEAVIGRGIVLSRRLTEVDELTIRVYFETKTALDKFVGHLQSVVDSSGLFKSASLNFTSRFSPISVTTIPVRMDSYVASSTSPQKQYLTLEMLSKFKVPVQARVGQLRQSDMSDTSDERSAGSQQALDSSHCVAQAQFIDVVGPPILYQRCHLKDRAVCKKSDGIDEGNESNMVAMSERLHSLFDGRNLTEGMPVVMPFAVPDTLDRRHEAWPDRRRVFFGLGAANYKMTVLDGLQWREDAVWDEERDVVWTGILVLDPNVTVKGTEWKMASTRDRMNAASASMGTRLAEKMKASADWLRATHLQSDEKTPLRS